FQAEDGIRDRNVTGVQTCALPISVAGEPLDLMYFWGEKDLAVLRSDIPKSLVFECNVSKFRGKEYVKGFVRAVIYDGAKGEDVRSEERRVGREGGAGWGDGDSREE